MRIYPFLFPVVGLVVEDAPLKVKQYVAEEDVRSAEEKVTVCPETAEALATIDGQGVVPPGI